MEHMSAARGFGSFVSYNDSFSPLYTEYMAVVCACVCVDYIILKINACVSARACIKYKISYGEITLLIATC